GRVRVPLPCGRSAAAPSSDWAHPAYLSDLLDPGHALLTTVSLRQLAAREQHLEGERRSPRDGGRLVAPSGRRLRPAPAAARLWSRPRPRRAPQLHRVPV